VRWLLRLLWLDWSRAPISGTAMLLMYYGAVTAFHHGYVDRGLLFLILAQTWGLQRGPMPK
jgi:hypothetical protein